MKQLSRVSVFCAVLCFAVFATMSRANPTIEVGNIVLQPNQADQTVAFELVISSPTTIEDVVGFEFDIQVGDGGPDLGGTVAGPVVTGIELISGTIFSTATSPTQADAVMFDRARQSTVDFSQPIDLTGTPVIAKVTFSTVGMTEGTFPLLLSGVAGSFNTQLFDANGAIPIDITNGTVSIPEPGSLALVGVAGLVMFRRRRLGA